VLVSAGVLAGACTGRSHTALPPTTVSTNTSVPSGTGTGSVTVSPLFVSTNAAGKTVGVVRTLTVGIRRSPDKELRVAFTEDGVAGTGAQWEAAGWSAVTVATLLVGAPLTNREVDFGVSGKIDGPSAGALMTVATLAVMRGDTLLPDVTMTGTINPDGTIGPVGGIPDKVQAAIAAHQTCILIPTGERKSPNASRQLVDVVQEGARRGVTVTEVGNVYDAYTAMTGKDLPRTTPASNVQLDAATSRKLAAKVAIWGSRFSASAGDFELLSPTIRSDLRDVAAMADSFHAEATKLSGEGLQAGAFQKAVEAAAFAKAADDVGRNLPILLTQGISAFVSRIKASASITAAVSGLVDELAKFTPATVSDAGAHIAAYGDAIDAVSFSQLGQRLLDAHASSSEQVATLVTEGAVYNDLAGTLLDASKDVLDVGRDLGGAALRSRFDLEPFTQLLLNTSEANLNAFNSLIIDPAAKHDHVTAASMKERFANIDPDYSLASTELAVLRSLPTYFGKAATSNNAEIGGAISLYQRTAGLIAKYTSLGQVDPNTLAFTGISNDEAFSSAIASAQLQLASTVALLRSKDVNPTIAVADNEVAGIDREGDANEKLSSLNEYWGGYLNGRVLAYIGGFANN
jgi:uncharacterized protein